MNLLLFIFVLLISVAVVRIGAVAFQLTGLEWSLAKFQSLSCFTGTGFTTKEAELITGSPQRRKIATVLMVLGHAGLVALIATFANSIDPDSITAGIKIPLLSDKLPPTVLAAMNLLIIIGVIYAVFRVLTRTKVARQITDYLRGRIAKERIVKPVSFEELAVLTGGYGISRIEVTGGSFLLNRAISESELKSQDVTILALDRASEIIANPPAQTKILLNDELICFGKLDNIRAVSGQAAGAVSAEEGSSDESSGK